MLNVLPRRLPVPIAGVAMKLEATSTQPDLKFVASEGNGLVMIVWTCDVELGLCGHSLCTSLKRNLDAMAGWQPGSGIHFWQDCCGLLGAGERRDVVDCELFKSTSRAAEQRRAF